MHNSDVKVETIDKTLRSFKIKCDNINYVEGDVVDQYNLKLSPGIKIASVDKALLDIGISLKAHSRPIGYPILNEGVYRIEVQKRELESPVFSDFLEIDVAGYSPAFLGRDCNGGLLIKDLSKIPNLLVGGIPGSGKSILLHSIIMSEILAGAELYLVDPKMVEFHIYSDFKNVECIVHSVEETMALLKYINAEMNERFVILKNKKVRDVIEYNKKYKKKMRPIVIVIDEWADLVLKDRKVQESLCLVAQKGRAAGISSVIATQRPSAKVISGLIKSNFPGRIAMKVASAVDSRIVLDQSGAESIIDVGVGLYMDNTLNKPILFRSPWIKDMDEELSSDTFKGSKKSFFNRIFG